MTRRWTFVFVFGFLMLGTGMHAGQLLYLAHESKSLEGIQAMRAEAYAYYADFEEDDPKLDTKRLRWFLQEALEGLEVKVGEARLSEANRDMPTLVLSVDAYKTKRRNMPDFSFVLNLKLNQKAVLKNRQGESEVVTWQRSMIGFASKNKLKPNVAESLEHLLLAFKREFKKARKP